MGVILIVSSPGVSFKSSAVSLGSMLPGNCSSGKVGEVEMTGGSKLGSTSGDEVGRTGVSEVRMYEGIDSELWSGISDSNAILDWTEPSG